MLAYVSLCHKETTTLCPQKILAHGDLETVIKMTCRGDIAQGFDGTKYLSPSSENLYLINPKLYYSKALPEVFFHDEVNIENWNYSCKENDTRRLFGNMGDTVDAMRNIIRCLPHGEGLSQATQAYFGFEWKQLTCSAFVRPTFDKGSLRKPERFVMVRRDTNRDTWKQNAFYCYETLFFKLCETAVQYRRGKKVKEGVPRPRMLLEAFILCGGCVEGLKKVAVRKWHDYKTTHANVKTLSGFRGTRGEGAVEQKKQIGNEQQRFFLMFRKETRRMVRPSILIAGGVKAATGASREVCLSRHCQLGQYVLFERHVSRFIPLRCTS